ncbi:MAG: HTH domain-containing protein [candidate division Zixibacteria bacterium]
MSLETVENILLVINLLINRQKVTSDRIMNLCSVSRRTVYRYIKVIHRANFPVYYDRRLKEYRFLRDPHPQYGKFGLQDTALISFALVLLSNCTNEFYNSQVSRLMKKILSRQSIVFDESLDMQKNMIVSKDMAQDFSDALNSLIIYLAILFNKGVNIKLNSQRDNHTKLIIREPKLIFKDEWRVKEMDGTRQDEFYLSDIACVSILN